MSARASDQHALQSQIRGVPASDLASCCLTAAVRQCRIVRRSARGIDVVVPTRAPRHHLIERRPIAHTVQTWAAPREQPRYALVDPFRRRGSRGHNGSRKGRRRPRYPASAALRRRLRAPAWRISRTRHTHAGLQPVCARGLRKSGGTEQRAPRRSRFQGTRCAGRANSCLARWEPTDGRASANRLRPRSRAWTPRSRRGALEYERCDC
jgi:hypothetical protein